MKPLRITAYIIVSTAIVIATTSYSSSASKESVTTAISDGCIATAGYDLPKNFIYDLEAAGIEKEVAPDKKLTKSVFGPALTGVAISLAATVVEGIFEQGANLIKSRAEDTIFSYDNVLSSSLYLAGPSYSLRRDNKDKIRLPIKLNPRLRCFTVVLGDVTIPSPKTQVSSKDIMEQSKWRNGWKQFGPSRKELVKRLDAANLIAYTKSGKQVLPWLVFEVALDFSEDGTAVRFVPRYFRALRLAKTGQSATRSIAVNLTLDKPTKSGANSAQVVQQSFALMDVTASHKSDQQSIGGLNSDIGWGPEVIRSIIGRQEWISFTPGTYTASSYLTKLFALDRFDENQTLPVEPLNIRSTVTLTENASEAAKFLADFIEKNSVTSTLSSALIEELGLITDEEKKAKSIEKITAERDLYIFWKNEYAKNNEGAEDFETNVARYQKIIDELNTSLAKLEQGCDPLGLNAGAAC